MRCESDVAARVGPDSQQLENRPAQNEASGLRCLWLVEAVAFASVLDEVHDIGPDEHRDPIGARHIDLDAPTLRGDEEVCCIVVTQFRGGRQAERARPRGSRLDCLPFEVALVPTAETFVRSAFNDLATRRVDRSATCPLKQAKTTS